GLSDLQARDRLQLAVLLTDGEPTVGQVNPAEIIRMVKEKNTEKRRVFVFGVGGDLNAKLLDLVANETRGATQYIRSEENLEVPLSNFFDKIGSPVLTELKIEFPAGGISDLYPRPLPDLFQGEQLEIFGRYQGDGQKTIVLRGKYLGEERVFEHSIPFPSSQNPFLPRLWAMRKIGYLLEQMRLSGESGELRDEVIRLSKRYGVITPYTSYLILEEDRLARRPADPGLLFQFAARDALSAPQARLRVEVEREARAFGADSGEASVEASRQLSHLKRGAGGGVVQSFVEGYVNA